MATPASVTRALKRLELDTAAAAAAFSNLTEFQRRILIIVETTQTSNPYDDDAGVSVDDVHVHLGGPDTRSDVLAALDDLCSKGYVYSTIDDDHYKSTTWTPPSPPASIDEDKTPPAVHTKTDVLYRCPPDEDTEESLAQLAALTGLPVYREHSGPPIGRVANASYHWDRNGKCVQVEITSAQRLDDRVEAITPPIPREITYTAVPQRSKP